MLPALTQQSYCHASSPRCCCLSGLLLMPFISSATAFQLGFLLCQLHTHMAPYLYTLTSTMPVAMATSRSRKGKKMATRPMIARGSCTQHFKRPVSLTASRRTIDLCVCYHVMGAAYDGLWACIAWLCPCWAAVLINVIPYSCFCRCLQMSIWENPGCSTSRYSSRGS